MKYTEDHGEIQGGDWFPVKPLALRGYPLMYSGCLRMKVLTAKLLLLLATLTILSGCASIGPPQAPSLELPKPPVDLHASRKGQKVTLTWTIPPRTTERQTVRYLGGTRVCRSLTAFKICTTPVGEASPPPDFEKLSRTSTKKPTANFVDTLPSTTDWQQPTAFAIYAVEVLNEAGRAAGLSNAVRIPLVPTLPSFSNFEAQATAPGVQISWRCPETTQAAANVRYLFRIYRRPEAHQTPAAPAGNESKIADVEATTCAEGADRANNPAVDSFLDQTFEWEKTYSYRGTVVSVVESPGKPTIEVEGDDTPAVKLFAHDVFPPAVPSGLQAVSSGPGQEPFIDLIWTPVTDADLAGYNVYRHEAGTATTKLNTEPVKTPAFRDTTVTVGKSYSYSVTAVDGRSNESNKSEETTETASNN
jgi:hypothetical protein